MQGTDDQTGSTTGTVEWYDPKRGLGAIRPDDGAPSCTVGEDTLRGCGISSLTAGDRVRFELAEDSGERRVRDLTVVLAVQRWENEGGAV